MSHPTQDLPSVAPAVGRQPAADDIAGIWAKVLRRDRIGHTEDFFDLGGNSMLLLAMLEVVQEKYDKQISTADLSEGVTVERLASLVA